MNKWLIVYYDNGSYERSYIEFVSYDEAVSRAKQTLDSEIREVFVCEIKAIVKPSNKPEVEII